MRTRRKISKAFTLVEILIVVVILGILAAIVVPQFTNATQDAQAGNIQSQLKTLQNQIELYAARNNGAYPDSTDADSFWGPNTGAPAGTLIADGYIKARPVNPAFRGADKESLAAVTGTATGSAAAAWVFNTTRNQLYASYFNETTGRVSATGTD